MSVETKYPLATPSWDEKELATLQRVIDTGKFSMGAEVSAFEKEFADWVGSKYAIMVNSGSSANLIMVAACFFCKEAKLQKGDEVIVPAVSWSTTYFPLTQYGLILRFVDVDPDTLNLDLDKLETAVTPKTKAVLIVNLLGNPNDFKKLKQVCDSKNLLLMEDNCESLGATFDGKQAGTFGLMGSYSTYFSHHMSTMEGGLVCTDDEELYHIMLSLRSHGWTRHLPKENHVSGVKSDDPFEESFKFCLPGYNLRPLELEGALGRTQLGKLKDFVAIRRRNAEQFCELAGNHRELAIQKEVGRSSWFGFSLIVKKESERTRKELVQLLTESGVEVRPIVAGNFLKNPVMKWLEYHEAGPMDNANWVDTNGLFVGNQERDLSEEIKYLADVLQRF